MKAILVVDIDDDFKFKKSWADITLADGNHKMWKRIAKVKPVPQKIEVDVKKIEDTMNVKFQTWDLLEDKIVADIKLETDKLIALGYNGCIDEILGDIDNE